MAEVVLRYHGLLVVVIAHGVVFSHPSHAVRIQTIANLLLILASWDLECRNCLLDLQLSVSDDRFAINNGLE